MGMARRNCPLGPLGPQSWRANHLWPIARAAALARDEFRCRFCGREDYEVELQVHHLRPLAGASRAGSSCRHHLDGLVTACVDCHREDEAFLRSGDPARQLTLPVRAA